MSHIHLSSFLSASTCRKIAHLTDNAKVTESVYAVEHMGSINLVPDSISVDVERGNGDGAEFWVRSVLHPTG